VRIALCIPTLGPPTWALFDSVGKWQVYHYSHHNGIEVDVIRPPRPLPINIARSWLVSCVLERDYDYLWFVDQDAKFLPETLDRLLAWQKPVVGALCLIRGGEPCWVMAFGEQTEGDKYRMLNQEAYDYLRRFGDCTINGPQIIDPLPPKSLVEVTFTGCHCLLIKREVLLDLEPPWFEGIPGQEDRYFCFKAREAGYPVYVDFSTFVGHVTGERSLGVFDFMAHFRYWVHLEEVYGRAADREGTES
jgi:GT2 family glycosyltransferase